MNDNTYSILGAVWMAIWIMRLASMIITYGWVYYLTDGILELVFLILMVVLGLIVVFYPYLKKHGGALLYKVNKKARCPDCYAKLNGATFCPKCGRDLIQRSVARTCWNCGYVEEDPSVNSCPKCGREFKKE